MAENQIFKDITERVKQLVAESGMTDQDFAKAIGMNRIQLSRTLKGEMNFTLASIRNIIEHQGVTASWLIDGDLPKEKSGPSTVPDPSLLTQFRKQIQELDISLQALLADSSDVEDPGKDKAGSIFQPTTKGKRKKSDKQSGSDR